jgi:serine/threonine-protein phosphatase PGAM5
MAQTTAELISSTMTRAEQTAAIIHAELPSVPEQATDLLRECTPPMPASVKVNPQEQVDSLHCKDQLDEAFARYFNPASNNETDVLVCHGNVIRYFVTKAPGVDTRSGSECRWVTSALRKFRLADGAMRVIAVGELGHLPPNLQSGLGQTTPDLNAPPIGP